MIHISIEVDQIILGIDILFEKDLLYRTLRLHHFYNLSVQKVMYIFFVFIDLDATTAVEFKVVDLSSLTMHLVSKIPC